MGIPCTKVAKEESQTNEMRLEQRFDPEGINGLFYSFSLFLSSLLSFSPFSLSRFSLSFFFKLRFLKDSSYYIVERHSAWRDI